jgi:pantoate--beta-alanine ligase
MGALHRGHGALIECARTQCEFVVVSVFVNPIQFDRKEDYDRYARTAEADGLLCQSFGVDAVFAPSVEEMFPPPQYTSIEVAEVSKSLCGEFRPGHFRGVATVVGKLFNIVQPHIAYFGEKDAQQLAVIEKMVADLNFPVKIVPVATVREQDGLAMSSRNARLSAEERSLAPVIYRALQEGQHRIEDGLLDPEQVKQGVLDVLGEVPQFRVEYLEVVSPTNMQPVERIAGPVRIAVAGWLGSTRLIDNVLCRPSGVPGAQ